MANDPSLAALAALLKRTQGQRVMENSPQTVHVAATAPALPSYQAAPSMLPSMADYMKKQAPPVAPAPTPVAPPVQTAQPPMQPPPSIAPGDQPGVVPPMPPPTQIGPNTPSFWERLNMANRAQQVPNYGMAMGQQLQNI